MMFKLYGLRYYFDTKEESLTNAKETLNLNYFSGLKLLINLCVLRFVIVKENLWNGWNATALDATVNRRDPRLSELFNYFGTGARWRMVALAVNTTMW